MPSGGRRVGSAVIDYFLNDGQFIRASHRVDRSMRRTGGATNTLGRRLRRLQTRLIRLGGINGFSGLAGGLAGVGLGFAQAFRGAAEFDASLTKSRFLVGISADETERLRDSIYALSNQYGVSTSELGGGGFAILSAGIRDTDKAVRALTAATQGSVLGLGTVDQIATAATRAIAAYNDQTVDAERVTRALWSTVREGNIADASVVADAFGRLGASAAALGIEVEQLGGAFAQLSRSQSPEQATTALRGLFTVLQKPPVQTQQLFAKYGLSLERLRRVVSDRSLVAGLQLISELIPKSEIPFAFRNIEGLNAIYLLGYNNIQQSAELTSNVVQTNANQWTDAHTGAAESIQNTWNVATRNLSNEFERLANSMAPVVDVLALITSSFVDFRENVATVFDAYVLGDTIENNFLERLIPVQTQIDATTERLATLRAGVERLKQFSPDYGFASDIEAANAEIARLTANLEILRQTHSALYRGTPAPGFAADERLAFLAEQGRQGQYDRYTPPRFTRSVPPGYEDVLAGQAEAAAAIAAKERPQVITAAPPARPERPENLLNVERELSSTFEQQAQALRHQSALAQARLTGSRRAVIEANIENDLARQRLDVASDIAELEGQRNLSFAENVELHHLREQLALLNQMSAESFPDVIQQQVKWGESTDRAVRQFERMQTITQGATGAFNTFFSSLIAGTSSVSEGFRRLGLAIIDAVAQAVVVQPIANALGGAFGSAFGNIFAAPPRAMGGPVLAGQPYVVGERRPELFVPSQSGRVSTRGGGGVQIVQNINVADKQGVQTALAEATPALVAQVTGQVLERLQRPGAARGY